MSFGGMERASRSRYMGLQNPAVRFALENRSAFNALQQLLRSRAERRDLHRSRHGRDLVVQLWGGIEQVKVLLGLATENGLLVDFAGRNADGIGGDLLLSHPRLPSRLLVQAKPFDKHEYQAVVAGAEEHRVLRQEWN